MNTSVSNRNVLLGLKFLKKLCKLNFYLHFVADTCCCNIISCSILNVKFALNYAPDNSLTMLYPPPQRPSRPPPMAVFASRILYKTFDVISSLAVGFYLFIFILSHSAVYIYIYRPDRPTSSLALASSRPTPPTQNPPPRGRLYAITKSSSCHGISFSPPLVGKYSARVCAVRVLRVCVNAGEGSIGGGGGLVRRAHGWGKLCRRGEARTAPRDTSGTREFVRLREGRRDVRTP